MSQNLKVVAMMERIKELCGVVPKRIHVDNGSKFISKALRNWAYDNQVTLDFSRPGKPTDNPFIASFNGSRQPAAGQYCLAWFCAVRRRLSQNLVRTALATFQFVFPPVSDSQKREWEVQEADPNVCMSRVIKRWPLVKANSTRKLRNS